MIFRGLSPAKINLTLDVFPKKNSEKFHRISTIFHKIAIFDKIEITENPRLEISGFNFPAEKNLIFSAFFLAQKFFKKKLPRVKILVKKKIPIGGGMAGGSSNFATFLKIFFQFLGEKIPQKLIEKSADFGKDIPFFFAEKNCAAAENFGEKIRPTNFNFSGQKIWIFRPQWSNPTKFFFQNLQNFGTNFSKNFLKNPAKKNCGNAFDEFFAQKNYAEILQKIPREKVHFSGTGACFFSTEKLKIPHCQIFETEFL